MSAARKLLILISTLLLLLLYTLENRRLAATHPAQPRADLRDFYEIFQDEIRPYGQGNVFREMGNRFQLEGRVYQRIWQGLDAYEVLAQTLASPAALESLGAGVVGRQEARVEEAFQEVLSRLSWPRYQVRFAEDGIQCSRESEGRIYQLIRQPVLFQLVNRTGRPLRVALEGADLEFSRSRLQIDSDSVRYLLATHLAQRQGPTKLGLAVSTGSANLETELQLRVMPTALLEGRLEEEAGTNRPMARVRVTDQEGRFFPPEEARSGLILKVQSPETGQDAERWFYAEKSFRVRVPAGAVKVSLRRGLEYLPIERQLILEMGEERSESFLLSRWIDMEGKGWYSGDAHIHMLDPKTTLFEMRAEDLRVANVLALDNWGDITARDYFRGELDPVSDPRHLVYYGEEYRHGRLGHVGFLALKRLVEPISIGRTGLPAPGEGRVRYAFHLRKRPLPAYGTHDWPDHPLLLEAMKEVHGQGGLVNWAHLRKSQWEFPIDIALGQVDTVDLLTDTHLEEALELWYDLLNCGFRLGPTAGTDRSAPATAVGHQRVYVQVEPPFLYPRWIEGLRKGASFVTNGPMLELQVDRHGPGSELKLSGARSLRIRASVVSQLPFQRLEVVSNGRILKSVQPEADPHRAELEFQTTVEESCWIAARCLGSMHPEIHFPHPSYRHPVVAHTGAVYVSFQGGKTEQKESACHILDFLEDTLIPFMEGEAYFASETQRRESLETIRKGMAFYQGLCGSRAPIATQFDGTAPNQLDFGVGAGLMGRKAIPD